VAKNQFNASTDVALSESLRQARELWQLQGHRRHAKGSWKDLGDYSTPGSPA